MNFHILNHSAIIIPSCLTRSGIFSEIYSYNTDVLTEECPKNLHFESMREYVCEATVFFVIIFFITIFNWCAIQCRKCAWGYFGLILF